MGNGERFRIAIRVPEVFYVLRNHESMEPDRFAAETELIEKHQSEERNEDNLSEEVRLGRNQIKCLCRVLKSTFTTETKNISSFKNYIFNLESKSKDAALLEVTGYLQEMRAIELDFKGENISKFFLSHWAGKGENFYFILK
ncbi:MAG: hypothetical protein HOK41_00550, partial [Nitrospina sp.]|nr:hypothetical protein [Nitrospina sp.]